MRITFLLPGFPRKPVGGYRVVYEHANRLTARGHEVVLIHPALLPSGTEPPGEGTTMRIRRLLDGLGALLLRPRPRWFDLDPDVTTSFVPRLSVSGLPKADIVVSTWWATAEFAAGAPPSRGRGVYLVQGLETWGASEDRIHSTWRLPMHKIAVSRWLRDEIVGTGLNPGEVTHIPNGIDHGVFRILKPIEERGLSVSFMAAPEPLKGTADAIAAVERVKARWPALVARAFGTAVRPAGLPEWVEYVRRPSRSSLARDVYGQSAVFLYSSHTEGWGLPGAEAMACGCAVVSTDSGGVRDYIRHEETGLLSPPGDVDALVENLEALLADPDRRTSLALSGAEFIRHFDWDRSTDQLENLLQSLLRGPPEPRGAR